LAAGWKSNNGFLACRPKPFLSFKPGSETTKVNMNNPWDVIVVGGGLAGSSIAYHLAQAGVRTMLVEQGDLASGASGANFGNVQVQDADLGISLPLTIQGARRCAELENQLNFDLGYRKAGSLLLIENEGQQALMAARVTKLHEAGLQAELLDQDALIQLEPNLSPNTVQGGLYHPHEGQLNPFKLVHAYALRGQEAGLEVRPHTAVTKLKTENGRITGVVTQAGPLSAGVVVLATGAWTRAVGRTAGVEIPASRVHGEAVITEALPPAVSNAMSSASFFEEADNPEGTVVALALNQRMEGNVMLGEAVTTTLRLNREVAEASVAAIALEGARRLPDLKQASIIRCWGIPVAHTADNCPLLGPLEALENLYVAAALKSTIVLTPMVGEIMTDMILGREIDPQLEAFSPSRVM
jgi:sarcosine oxidase subunit beta